MTEDSLRQSILDAEHLKLLSIGYMISAGMSAFGSLFGLIYVFIGIMVSSAIAHAPKQPADNGPPLALFAWLFGGLGFLFFATFIALAAAKLRAAFCIRERNWRTFCMVVAGFSCIEVPYGTLLGVFTFIVLGRPSVMQSFEGRLPPAA